MIGKAGTPLRARTLFVNEGAVRLWPSIALTEKRGAVTVPLAADVLRFWISRLHGALADDRRVLHRLNIAVRKLTEGDETSAQKLLDPSGLTRFSPDGLAPRATWRACSGLSNLAHIPTMKHWEITGWHMTPNDRYNHLSAREYLKGKSGEERKSVGIKFSLILKF
ncbi:MAG TPA: hypothetical protein VME69_06255 [Methylocella sp.]|nr:hypothetical protein [Methylocella sp.]